MTEINANSPLHNINPPITGINPPPENGNPVNPVNNGVSAPEQNVAQKGTEAKSLSLKLDSMMIRAAQLATRSVDVNALAETVKDVPLDENVRTALDDAAERAKSALSELPDDEETALLPLLERKLGGSFEQKNTDKAIRYFLYRGYELGDIRACIEILRQRER